MFTIFSAGVITLMNNNKTTPLGWMNFLYINSRLSPKAGGEHTTTENGGFWNDRKWRLLGKESRRDCFIDATLSVCTTTLLIQYTALQQRLSPKAGGEHTTTENGGFWNDRKWRLLGKESRRDCFIDATLSVCTTTLLIQYTALQQYYQVQHYSTHCHYSRRCR